MKDPISRGVKALRGAACAFLILVLLLGHPGIHGSARAEGSPWMAVSGPCNLSFPEDHGAHPDYRVEWWYYTGNLASERNERYGYQLTFFRYGAAPPGAERDWPRPRSAWRASQIYFAHAALSDISGKRHLSRDISARSALDLSGVDQEHGTTRIHLRGWSAEIAPALHLLKADTGGFGIDLALKPLKDVVLHGRDGYSMKGSTPEKASCYYSYTRLDTEGELTLDGKKIRVHGESWMDHEFSSAPLEPDAVGWDWFGLQLSDRSELMFYLLRMQDGTTNAASSGTYVDATGKAIHLPLESFSVSVRDHWRSPRSGAVYPSGWKVSVRDAGLDLTVTPNIPDQEMATPESTGITYWEGSVSVAGTGPDGAPATGAGYAELTGYAGSAGERLR